MAERLIAAVLKTVEGVSLPGVQIPPPPPVCLYVIGKELKPLRVSALLFWQGALTLVIPHIDCYVASTTAILERSMTITLVQQVARTLAPHPEIQLAFVFGSAARDALRPDSDVDVAVLAASRLSPEARLELMAELGLAVKREIDLVDLSTAWGLILRQVLTTGTLALKRSDTAHAMLLKRMLFDQADMEPLRQRIIEKSLERGF